MVIPQRRRSLIRSVAVLACFLVPAVLYAQPQTPPPAEFNGTFKGTAKMASGEMAVTLELKSADGKISGRAIAANSEYQITKSELVAGKLTLKFAAGPEPASLTLERKGDMLAGDWVHGTQKSTVELKKIDPAAKDEISGEWDAVADAQGEAFPFTLILKLDGEKVSGSSRSQLGTSQISTGIWKDGRLSLDLDSANGAIGFVATMTDGKLVGDYDYLGQLQGKFVAVRKK